MRSGAKIRIQLPLDVRQFLGAPSAHRKRNPVRFVAAGFFVVERGAGHVMSYRLQITSAGVLGRFANQLAAVGEKKAKQALQRAIAHTGDKAKTQVIRALTKQTGLKRDVIVRAVRIRKPSYDDLRYVMTTRGGDISLQYFSPRETSKGVSATAFGRRAVHPGTFMKAGWWPGRVQKDNWNGQVFRRTGNITRKGEGMDEFEKVDSGVVIPDQMVKGMTLAAWRTVAERDLANRVGHELGRMLGGR
jgi:hypothetical protein